MRLCAMVVAIGSLAAGVGTSAAGVQTLAERIELQDWDNPARAARLIDAAATPSERRLLDVPMLEVSGMVYTDMHREADVVSTLADLQARAARGDPSAAAAARYVRAYALHQRGDYSAAVEELNPVDVEAMDAAAEKYRFLMLRGGSLRRLRQVDEALPPLRRALELAQRLGDDARSAHALLELAAARADAGELAAAGEQLASVQALAATLGEEAVLTALDGALADLAERRGDRVAERRLRLSSLDHAKAAESDKWLAQALVKLGGSYLHTGEFRESLKYSKLAAPLVARTGASSVESVLSLNEGLALISLGNLKPGQERVERAITDAEAHDNLLDERSMLRNYAQALERAGYLMMAIQAYQRDGALGDRLLSSAHADPAEPTAATHQAVRMHRVALPADDEPIDPVEAARSAGQRHLRQQLVIALVLGGAGICTASIWAFCRVRQAEERLRRSADRDALTGLWSRAHFNEKMLPVAGDRLLSGCVLLADLDHFKRINHTWGHPAGDAALKTLSARLAALLRDGHTLVRWEGEKFLVLLAAVTPEQANQTVERLLHAVRSEPVSWGGASLDCTISIGYACFPLAGAPAGISLIDAVNLVDQALHQAKRRGRDRACLISAVSAAEEAINVVDSNSNSNSNSNSDAAPVDRTIELTEMGVAA